MCNAIDHLDHLIWWVLICVCAGIVATQAGAAPATVGAVVSGWNVKTPQNPGGYTESPYLSDGITISPQAFQKIHAVAPYGGVIRYTGAQQTQGSSETSLLDRSSDNLSIKGITWEGISAMSNATHTSPWVAIPQGALGGLGTVNSYAFQFGLNLGQRLDSRIPSVYLEYSNELWNGGDQLNGTANLFRARSDPTLTATTDFERMAQEAGKTWALELRDFTAGIKASNSKAQVHGVFGGFIANQYWAQTALTFAKQSVPGLDLSHSRLAIAPYAPGAPSDIGGIQTGDTAASIIARSTSFAQQYFPSWIGSNKAVADSFGMEGLAAYETMGGSTYDFTSGTTLMADMNRSAPEMRAFESWFFNFVSDLMDGKLDGKNIDPGAPLEIFGTAGIPYNNVNSFAPWEFYESPDSPKALGIIDFINANAVNHDPFAVPEPTTLLAGLWLLALWGMRRGRA